MILVGKYCWSGSRQQNDLAAGAGLHHARMRKRRVFEWQLGTDDGIERAGLEAGDDRLMRAAQVIRRNSPQRQAKHRHVLGHDLPRVDLDAAAVADDDNPAAGRNHREVVIEIHVGKHLENDIGSARAGQFHNLVEIARVPMIHSVMRALRANRRQPFVGAGRADHRGASGGVGVAATQFAVACGATVIGTAGTDDGLATVRAQGAHRAVNHRQSGYLDEITKLSDGRGPDVILEMLANVNLDHDLTVVAPSGRIVVIGNRGRVEIDARKIMTKDVSVFGLALWGIPQDDVRRAHQAIIAGLGSGALNPVVGTEMPLKDAALAHTRVMEPGARGKIILIP